MSEVYEQFTHAGVVVEIVNDNDPVNDPQDNDNAGTIYSWTRDFGGDEKISDPHIGPLAEHELTELVLLEAEFRATDASEVAEEIAEIKSQTDLSLYFAHHYDAALTIPLRFGSNGARIYSCDDDDANAALVFTQAELDREWSGHVDPYTVTTVETGEVREYGGARAYAEARIGELDLWMQGYVFGIVIRREVGGEVLESVWGFIGDPGAKSGEWIRDEARSMAKGCAEALKLERNEAYAMACRDIETVTI